MYGETTGEKDEHNMPVRLDWARNYLGPALVVHGHVVVDQPTRTNNSCNVDTGCCFGGSLTAFRYPENITVSTKAHRIYHEPFNRISAYSTRPAL